MHAQPLIVVSDVEASSRWYQTLLDCESGHGGNEYERILHDGEIILQLHHEGIEHHHGPLANTTMPYGNGLLLWFQTDDFDAAIERAVDLKAEVIKKPHINPNANQKEIWLRDPDGYTVVIAGQALN